MPDRPTIKVLSIDGGGIRGIIPAQILNAITTKLGQPPHRIFDLISGTSTGGIIALGIGSKAHAGQQPYTPAELTDMYVDNGPKIFDKSFFTLAKQLIGPKYSPKPLEEVLQKFFGDTLLSSALTPLLACSYDLQGQLPFFFKSHKIAISPDFDWNVWQIARSTSAAPTYFPPFHLQRGADNYALVDGGIFVNNPAVAAFVEAIHIYGPDNDFVVVSVGTGDRNDRITYDQAKGWGLLGWAKQIVPVMMDSVSEAVDYELHVLAMAYPAFRHFRLQPRLTIASADMDNVTAANLANLKAEAAKFIQDNLQLIDQVCNALQGGRGSNLPGIGRPAAAEAAHP